MDSSSAPKPAKEPYEALRDGLIWGRWKSGERLKPQHLKVEFGCSSAALREALLRLVGEGFVASEKNLGFRAVEHTEETFRQAAHMRLLLETEGAELSLARGDFDWEMALNAAHHNLAYIEVQMAVAEDVEPFVERWSRQDWHFHSTLISACGSAMLMKTYKAAFDTFRMYNVSQMPDFGFSAVTRGEHQAIYDAAIVRDIPACMDALRVHLALYADNNRSSERLAAKGDS